MTAGDFATAARPHAAAMIIFRDGNKIAFLLRKNTKWMNDHYGLPGGKVEHGESYSQAAIREAAEEVGVQIAPEHLEHRLTINRKSTSADGMYWTDTVFEAVNWTGDLHNAEPHQHAELVWFDVNELPDNTIPVGIFYLDQIFAGNRYAEYGWED